MLFPALVGVAAGIITLVGGLVAIRVQDGRHLVLAASGGVLLGVVAFDLLPEAFFGSDAMFWDIPATMVLFVVGFVTIHIVEKALALHQGSASHYVDHAHDARPLGLMAGGALVAHSFLDGLGIGVAFAAGTAVAVSVAIAVLAHDFADGFNTFTLTAEFGNSRRRAVGLLIADALAPIAGAIVGSALDLSAGAVALYLAYFAGFLLHIAAAKILPEAHADHPSWGTLASTLGGIVVIGAIMAVS